MFGNRMKHCLVFASLISPSKMILFEKKYQTFDTVFHHQMKHLEVRQKYSAARRIFNSLLGVSSGDETLHLMFDILRLYLSIIVHRIYWTTCKRTIVYKIMFACLPFLFLECCMGPYVQTPFHYFVLRLLSRPCNIW